MYYKKISIVLLVVLGLGLILAVRQLIISEQGTEDKNNIVYTSANNTFYWVIRDNDGIFDIRPAFNIHIKNFNGDLDMYLENHNKEYNYKEYLVNARSDKTARKVFNSISISENPHETNYFQDKKMIYGFTVDSTGKVFANVSYPDELIGGYTFNLSPEDFNTIKNIQSKINTPRFCGGVVFV